MSLLVPIGRVTTTRARLPDVVATIGDDLGRWQVCGRGDPGAWVGSILTWTEHRVALLAQRFGPALYDKRLLGATRCSRYSLDPPRAGHRAWVAPDDGDRTRSHADTGGARHAESARCPTCAARS